MDTTQTRKIAGEITQLLRKGETDEAYILLSPILADRIPFRLLDIIGERIGMVQDPSVDRLIKRIIAGRTEGGWVVIASAYNVRCPQEPQAVFDHSRQVILQADVWFATDIFGERVTGPALVSDFDQALLLLDPWRFDQDRWVRRCVGVSAHLWAKRVKGAPDRKEQAGALLTFLEPMFTEWEMDAVKGVAWGLKTLGRYYPDLVTNWLIEEILPQHPTYRAHMLRKTCLFLTDEQKAAVTEAIHRCT